MKVLFVVNDLDFFLSHRLAIAYEALNRGDEVFVASNRLPDKEYDSINFLSFKFDRSNLGIIQNFNALISLKRLIKGCNPDLIHNVTLKPILFTNILFLFNRKIKIVNAISGLGFLFTKNRNSALKSTLQALIRVILIKKSSHYIFQNIHDLNEFKKLGVRDNFTLIRGSGVDSKEFGYVAPRQKQKVNITFTGRMLKDKGVIELIQAVNLLPEKFKSKITLNLYGKIDLQNPAHLTEVELKQKLSTDLIIWHRQTNKIKQALQDSDIYCLPSYREGLPKSTLEAMAIGRPVVTTDAPGCEDTVVEGENGFKVPVADAVTLSSKLQLLIENKKLRIKMGRKSRKIFEDNFTLEKVVGQTFEVYSQAFKN
tara:strand:- start:3943 stop:5049 length:1107 start_codon:yes stop_codon:yes gene_type:complete